LKKKRGGNGWEGKEREEIKGKAHDEKPLSMPLLPDYRILYQKTH